MCDNTNMPHGVPTVVNGLLNAATNYKYDCSSVNLPSSHFQSCHFKGL